MIIEAHDLRKTFTARRGRGKTEEVEAVRGIDLSVGEGEIFACLGPNGAGKTTTVRMLATFTVPTSGTARVAGFDVVKEAAKVREKIGYVGQAGGIDDNAPGRESLVMAARIAGLSRAQALGRADELMAAFSLTEIADRPVKTLSGGQKRRFSLAIGLVNRPPLVFLDEPTTGLDPQNRANLWDEIRALRDQGTSVLLTTHYLDEADALCDRLVIVDHGRIVAEGTAAELKKEVAGDVVTLRLDDLAAARGLLDAEPYIKETQEEGGSLRAYLDDGEHNLPALLRALEAGGLAIRSISLDRATLDDVFLKHTGRSLRDAA
ncbi:daunorubicin resistance protein DrrA family ABC transporter ATP-binding protein [Planomonospora parontospora subsp. parontospora]|uniref:Daunorubicin resistance protein DrrA family ABC transporter ATP-binding protein n=2 Tax=Planomonospora parontospora TaxID=58119 RepID=A0AA37F5D1_9ACTN|nr:ATP-binding cassette domain-containing protein [Planomonospora parontospora]GGK74862.1 daunorubicin resistance protein DrrA family ABC transporter ATP-binding protein [Planomonospora parontospora]GII09538.1 daunorubicin resistance protein DrrA family ABC transporter ATP-binding protein [Planomonospora parontospora subsp. parontospora]